MPAHPRREEPASRSTRSAACPPARRRAGDRNALYTYVLERYVCAPFRRSGEGECNVIVGDLIQSPNRSELGYNEEYIKRLNAKFAAPSPKPLAPVTRYSIHPYTDIDAGPGPAYSSTTVSRLIDQVPDTMRIWYLEAGSRLDARGGNAPKTLPEQQKEVAYLTDVLASTSRVDRVYYYSFCPEQGSNGGSGFDSSLYAKVASATAHETYCTSNSSARPALTTYSNRTNG